jgi:hypothetical protein
MISLQITVVQTAKDNGDRLATKDPIDWQPDFSSPVTVSVCIIYCLISSILLKTNVSDPNFCRLIQQTNIKPFWVLVVLSQKQQRMCSLP